jgi:raffinose/stachyose/melibiose transport system permease protein
MGQLEITQTTIIHDSTPPWKRKFFRRHIVPRMFLFPILFIHTLVVAGPAVAAIYYSFTNWNGIGKASFIGLENYRRMLFIDKDYRTALLHNIIWMAITLVIAFGLSLLTASILAQVKRGNLIYRLLLFIPYVMPSVVVAAIWRSLLHPDAGIGPWLLSHGLPGWNIALFGSQKWALLSVILADNWRWWVFPMVLLLTAMQNIPKELYDAARIDGADRWQEFRYITIPGIRPTLIFLVIMTVAWSFVTYEYVFVLTNGSPGGASELLGTLMLKRGIAADEAGYAAAIGVSTGMISMFIIFIFTWLRRRGWEI